MTEKKQAADAIEALEAEVKELHAAHSEYMQQYTSAYNVQAANIKRLMTEVEAGNTGLHQLREKNVSARAERDALQAQLAATQGQEPVAYMVQFSPGSRWIEVTKAEFNSDIDGATVYKKQAFYAAPIPQQPAEPAQPVDANVGLLEALGQAEKLEHEALVALSEATYELKVGNPYTTATDTYKANNDLIHRLDKILNLQYRDRKHAAITAAQQAQPERECGKEVPVALDHCPITGMKFWGNISHPKLGYVATYGGPFDTYTIPSIGDDGELRSERYDQDAGEWTEGGEPIGWFSKEQFEQAQPERAPLSIQEIADAWGLKPENIPASDIEAVREIEAAHGIGTEK